jgi:predicted O-methyltransferase YrrM
MDTIEADPVHATVGQANFVDLDLCPFPKTHVGKALALLRDKNGPFAQAPGASEGFPPDECGYDIVFVDANKDEYFEYFLEGMRLARKGGVLVFDNAIRQGR